MLPYMEVVKSRKALVKDTSFWFICWPALPYFISLYTLAKVSQADIYIISHKYLFMKYFKYLAVLAALACSCQNNSEKWASVKPVFTEIPTPCKAGEAPNLFVSSDGQVYLTWVEFLNGTTDALLFSKLENGQWGKAATIAQGADWFVNWADFPSLAANGNWLAAHWLQKSAGGTYDYDVRIAQSKNGGQQWAMSNQLKAPHLH